MNPSDVRFHIYGLEGDESLVSRDMQNRDSFRVEWIRRFEDGWEMPPVNQDLPVSAEDWILEARWLIKIHATIQDPADRDYLHDALTLANRIARSTRGLVYDQHGQRYLSAQELRGLVNRKRFCLLDHVIVHRSGAETEASLHTHGMAKFGFPDLRIQRVPERHVRLGAGLLMDVANAMLDGMDLETDDMLDVGPGYLRVAEATPLPEEEPPLYGQLDLLNYDLISDTASPDLEPFLDGVKATESARR